MPDRRGRERRSAPSGKTLVVDNAALAERLEAFAALLDLARLGPLHGARLPARGRADPLDAGGRRRARPRRAASASSPGSGPGSRRACGSSSRPASWPSCEELEAQALPELVGVARLLGLSPKRMRELGHALGIRTLAGAARGRGGRAGSTSVPGIGPKTAARIESGLAELATARPRRGMLLNRARALVGEVAAALGGEPAGDPRRACDLSTRFAVVVPLERLPEAESLPQLVAVLERDDRRVVGVTAEGYPIEVVGATPRAGNELVRATGSAEWVGSATAERLSRSARCRRPSCASSTRRRPPPDLLELGDIRGDLHVHTTASDGKATVEEMGRAAPGARLRVPRDLRPHAQRARRPRARRGRPPPPRRGDRRRERAAGAVPDPPRQRVRHPPGRLARPPRRRARRARVGADQPARGPALGPRRRSPTASSRRCAIRLRAASRTRRGGSSTTGPRTRSTSSGSSRSRSRPASRSR